MPSTVVQLLLLVSISQTVISRCNADAQVDIQPMGHQLYWYDSDIEITCRSSSSLPVVLCIWSINNKTIDDIDHLVYQAYNEYSHGKCRIFVRTAARAESGQWTCRLFTAIDRVPTSSSITVTILKLSLREFWIIFSCLVVSMTLVVVIVWLVVKTRRLKMFQRREDETITTVTTNRCFPGALVTSTGSFHCDGEIDTPPPSYSSAVGSRIMAGECARLEFARFLNEMARHGQQNV